MTTTAAPSVRMTREQFAAKHSDFKATIDGRPYVLADCGAKGTCLVPVEIVAQLAPRVMCAWCPTDRPTVLEAGDQGAPTSHGICEPCAEKFGASQRATECLGEAMAARAAAFAG